MEIQTEILRKLFQLKDFDDLNAAKVKIIPPTLHTHLRYAANEDNSHQAKVRVRRRCLVGQWLGCKRPTKSSIPKPKRNRQPKRGGNKKGRR